MANKIKFFSNYIEITCTKGDLESQLLAGQIPYVHRNRSNTIFKTTSRNIDLVLLLFRNIGPDRWHTLPQNITVLLDKEIQRRIAQKTLVELGPDGEHEFLWRHQQLGRELARVNDKYGFFYDTRTGKTPMSLQIMLDDIKANPNHKWLVLCPLILIENAWLPDAKDMFPELKIVSLHAGTKDKRLALFRQKANVYVLNIESFASYRKEVEKLGIHGCIVDESSTMKSNSSKFGQEAVDYAWTLKRWYLLSGSPAPNGEWEYYRQLQSIDFYGVHESYNQFKLYFFDNTSRNPQYEKLKVKPERYSELLGLLQQYSLYVDKEDVLTTPGRDFIEVPLKLPPSLRENYEQLRNEMYLELGENVSITSPSAAATLNKLNQVSSGFAIDTAAMKYNKAVREHTKYGGELAYAELKQEDHLLSEYRFDALEELLTKHAGEQIIIWANYRKEFEIIKQRLGGRCECIYGGTNITAKNDSIQKFKKGQLQYLVANPASADKGLTLTNAHICIYFSMNYSYELWKQSKERIYGSIIKQPKKCIYYIMIATSTVDRAIYTTVENKGDMSMAILDHLKGGL